jgi:5'-nucleotidase
MKRIAIDMDEVLAKYTQKVIRTLKQELNYDVDLEKVAGNFLSQSLPQEYMDIVTSYPYREGFFRDLEVVEDSQEILARLNEKYNIYVVSATLQHPNAAKDKLACLHEHFPFIHFRNIVFCGDKSIIRADCLVDDHPRQLQAFEGYTILFSAFHNIHETRFKRAENWRQVEQLITKAL